jgi:uncharacterized protein (DUF1501 family)
MDRRSFLIRTGLVGCSLAADPFVTPIALAAAPWDGRLVVIILRGAMDGLDVVRPWGDPDFAALRPTLNALPDDRVGDFWGLHPALAPLLPLWRRGEFGAIHAVSTPYRDRRSHFDGQDILEAGTAAVPTGAGRDGWLNRMLAAVPGVTLQTAYAIGPEQLLILSGSAPVSRWTPEARLALSPQAVRLLDLVNHDDPLFREAVSQAMELVDDLEGADMGGGGGGGRSHIRLAEFAAARLREETRIASFSLGGWDTHARQEVGITRALSRLAEMILALRDGLGPEWDRTAVLCITEFGRTAHENGTGGTDHGTGGAVLFAGGALAGGRVLGDWPGLSEAALYAGRDLMPTRDLRAHAGWVMRGLAGIGRDVIERTVFPGLDLGPDPGLLR